MARSITIAIPTHNRAALLRGTLASLSGIKVAADSDLECIIVDNASSDATAQVAESASGTLKFPVRHVFEPRLGSSFARNRAIDEARGELICFIDDDVIVDSEWLSEMTAAIEGRGLDAACGMVAPQFLTRPPAWLGTR
ncbi:MAG: glycosyltransferase family 2 protein, partial [Candidatus Binataceae bacterium]